MRIGEHCFENSLALAPMAGVTDRPFRELCRSLGAGIAASEMISANAKLWSSRKSRLRLDHAGESGVRIVQIAGGDPEMIADAAARNQALGAQIIDINMGCPAKKVCNKLAGSALMKDEDLVKRILDAAVNAVSVPVTLKIRTGWDPDNRNGVRIAGIAQDSGISALAVHGRTRACMFQGESEYDTIRRIKQAVSIPVIANGDIDSPRKALAVLRHTGADGVMVGRAAQGRPWIFREIQHYFQTGRELPPPTATEVRDILLGHLEVLHRFYGETAGVRVARKHVGWYLRGRPGSEAFRRQVVRIDDAGEQKESIRRYFDKLIDARNTNRTLAA